MTNRSSRSLGEGFVKLWTASTVSEFGSLIGSAAVSFTAIIVLKATPFQISLLNTMRTLPSLVLALAAGVWVDRLRRRPILIGCDLARAVLLATIPAAALAGKLTMMQLYVVILIAEALNLFFDVAHRTYLPVLVRDDQLVAANARLSGSESAAEVGAFEIAGWLVQWLTAPIAILFDTLSFLISALLLALIRTPERAPEMTKRSTAMLSEIGEGIAILTREPTLRALAVAGMITGFASAVYSAVYMLFGINDLGFTPGILGMIFAIGGASSLVGAIVAQRSAQRVRHAMIAGVAIFGLLQTLPALAHGATPRSMVLLCFQQLGDGAFVVFYVHQLSLRQTIAPRDALGRVNASQRFIQAASAIAGSLAGGVLGNTAGLRATLLAGSLVTIATSGWLMLTFPATAGAPASPVNTPS